MMNNMLPFVAMDGDAKDALLIGAMTGGLSGSNSNRANGPTTVLESANVGTNNQNQNQNQNNMNNLVALELMDGVGDNIGALYAMNQMNQNGQSNNMMNGMLPFMAMDGDIKDAIAISAMTNGGNRGARRNPVLKSTNTEQTRTANNQPPVNPLSGYVAMEMLDGDAADLFVAEQMLSGSNPSMGQELLTMEVMDADPQDILAYEAATGGMNSPRRKSRPYSTLKKTHEKNQDSSVAASLNIPKKNEIVVWMVPLAVAVTIGSIILFICILNSIVGKTRKKSSNSEYTSILNDEVVSK